MCWDSAAISASDTNIPSSPSFEEAHSVFFVVDVTGGPYLGTSTSTCNGAVCTFSLNDSNLHSSGTCTVIVYLYKVAMLQTL